MTSSSSDRNEDNYVLQRNPAATGRLNYQYYLWQDALRFHLHPSIPPLPVDARVADVATGSGIWLLDLASEVQPTTRLDGFDISLDQTPPQGWLPSNVAFHTYNLFNEVPLEFVAAFDIVHVRMVFCLVKYGDPTLIIQNLTNMLMVDAEPGGYLQWEEYEHAASIVSVKPDLRADAVAEVRRLMSGESAKGSGEIEHSTSLNEAADQLLKEKDPEKARTIRELVANVEIETRKGAAVKFDKQVIVARKVED